VSVERGIRHVDQPGGDQRVGADQVGDFFKGQIGGLQFLAKLHCCVETDGEDNFPGKLLGDVFQHLKALLIECFAALVVGFVLLCHVR
jgi:hypothetical protein